MKVDGIYDIDIINRDDELVKAKDTDKAFNEATAKEEGELVKENFNAISGEVVVEKEDEMTKEIAGDGVSKKVVEENRSRPR